jgi:hypothetical protein
LRLPKGKVIIHRHQGKKADGKDVEVSPLR